MKKLVLMFVAMAAISFASCGNKSAVVEEEEGVEVVDSDSLAAADSIPADSVVAEEVAE